MNLKKPRYNDGDDLNLELTLQNKKAVFALLDGCRTQCDEKQMLRQLV